jgi:poly(3-hydroxybutyrate) depolymerase
MAAVWLLATLSARGAHHFHPQDTGFLNRSIEINGSTYKYQVYLPETWNPHQSWPMILFLHGSGERGSDGMDETQVGLPNAIRSHPERWPFVVVMPQDPYYHHYWTDHDIMTMAMAAFDAEVREFHGDPQRLYLTGLSLGGYGTWEIAKNYPGKFAAVVPVSGGIFWSYQPARWKEQQDLPKEYAHAIGRTPACGSTKAGTTMPGTRPTPTPPCLPGCWHIASTTSKPRSPRPPGRSSRFIPSRLR